MRMCVCVVCVRWGERGGEMRMCVCADAADVCV